MRRLCKVSVSAIALFLYAAFPVSAQQAAVALTQPNKVELIGDTVTFCFTFKNAGSATGFGPFVDLLFDAGGANVTKPGPPAQLCDGVRFVSAKVVSTNPPVQLVPTYKEPVANVPCAPGPSSIPHPYAAQGFLPVPALDGQQLTTLRLPFGSYTPTQPEIRIEVTAKIDQLADHNRPLTVDVRGGFRWSTLSSLSAWQTETLTPRAVILTKKFAGKDDEMVPGPSMPQKFDISVEVAPTPQSVTGLTVDDILPPGGTWVSSPFPQTWPSLAGGTTTTISPSFFVGNAVSPPTCEIPFSNTAAITAGAWIPLDPADPPPLLSDSASASITVKALAVQKSAHVLNPAGPLPGGQITYHLAFQVSDYLRFGNLVVTDTLTDGQSYVASSGKLTVSDRFGALTVLPLDPFIAPVINNVDHTYVCPPAQDPCHPPAGLGGGAVPGGNRYIFNVSQAMIAQAGAPPLSLGVLSGPASTSLSPSNTPAAGFIDFTVDITDAFTNQHGDDGKVSKDDPLYDDVEITGRRYTNNPLAPLPFKGPNALCSDHGSSCLAVPGDVLSKEVYAVNGVKLATPQNPLVPFPVTRGDVVTFRLWKTVLSGDAENVTVQDWLPQPGFDINFPPPFTPGSLSLCLPNQPGLVPLPAGSACYTAPPGVTLTANTDNSLTFDLQSFDDPNNQPLLIELFFSAKVTTAPYPDGLLHTNEAEECETNSYDPNTKLCQDAIAEVELQEPSLVIRKAVFCAGGCNQPSCVAGCPAAAVVTHSTIGALGLALVNSDASDVVTFVVSVENVGSGPNGAYDVQVSDNLGTIPGTIVNGSFCVRRGDGSLLGSGTDYTLSPANPATAWTLNLKNQGSLGSIPPLNAATTGSGANIILIFFSVKLKPPLSVITGKCDVNTAKLLRYTNRIGGQNFIGAPGLPPVPPVTATVCIALHDARKRIVTTSEPHTVLPNVTIGEIVRYELSVDVPEGIVGPITFDDLLPSRLEMRPGWTAALSTSGFAIPPVLPLNLPNIGPPGHPRFILPPFVNADNDLNCERLILRFNALVMNDAANTDGQIKPNGFTVKIGNGPAIASPPVSVKIVEPALTVTKTVQDASTPPLTAGAYTVTVTNASTVTAFDIEVLDIPSAHCMQAVANVQITSTGAVAGAGPWTAWPLKIARMGPGSTVKLTYSRKLTCNRCSDMVDNVKVTWTSLPGTGTPIGANNTTGAVTPGASGAVNGERNGNGTSAPPDNYIATASASFCDRVCGAKLCGVKLDGNQHPLAGWTIVAVPSDPSLPIHFATTDAAGQYCISPLDTPMGYTVSEILQNGWVQIVPASTVQVKTTCTKTPAGVWVGVTTPSPVRFVNRNVCAGIVCPSGQQCIAVQGQGQCVPIPPISPCATIRCGLGWHCVEVNGGAVCTP